MADASSARDRGTLLEIALDKQQLLRQMERATARENRRTDPGHAVAIVEEEATLGSNARSLSSRMNGGPLSNVAKRVTAAETAR